MVGKAICRQLLQQTDVQIITRTRQELDLCNQSIVQEFMKSEMPDEVILAAAKVGGIQANNTSPAEYIYQNLQIQNNVINAAHLSDVQKLPLFWLVLYLSKGGAAAYEGSCSADGGA